MFAIATRIDARKIVDRCAHKREAWWRRMRTASSDLRVRFQEACLHVPLRLRVELLEELRLHARGDLDDTDPRAGRLPLLLEDRPEGLEVPVALRAALRGQLPRAPGLLEAD